MGEVGWRGGRGQSVLPVVAAPAPQGTGFSSLEQGGRERGEVQPLVLLPSLQLSWQDTMWNEPAGKCAEICQTCSTGLEPLALPSGSQRVSARGQEWVICSEYHWGWQRQENLSPEPRALSPWCLALPNCLVTLPGWGSRGHSAPLGHGHL